MNVDAEDPLPGYTPSSNFGNCAADNLDTAYEKVVDVTYNRGTVTELTTRRVLSSSNNVIMYYICDCRNDIGIAVDCLQQCNDAGASCLAVLLRNERGGRQSCSSVTRCTDIIYRYYLHISTLYLSTILISSICHIIYLSTVLISIIVTSSAVADGTDPTSATGVTYFEKICISKLNIFSKYQMWTNLDSFSSFSISIDPLFNCSIQQPLYGL